MTTNATNATTSTREMMDKTIPTVAWLSFFSVSRREIAAKTRLRIAATGETGKQQHKKQKRHNAKDQRRDRITVGFARSEFRRTVLIVLIHTQYPLCRQAKNSFLHTSTHCRFLKKYPIRRKSASAPITERIQTFPSGQRKRIPSG